MEKTRDKSFYIRILQILGVSLAISLILTFVLDGNDNMIIRFIDNLFIIGGALLGIGAVFGLVGMILSFKHRKLIRDKSHLIGKKDSEIKEEEKEVFEKMNNFDRLYKVFAIAGTISFVTSIIGTMLI